MGEKVEVAVHGRGPYPLTYYCDDKKIVKNQKVKVTGGVYKGCTGTIVKIGSDYKGYLYEVEGYKERVLTENDRKLLKGYAEGIQNILRKYE